MVGTDTVEDRCWSRCSLKPARRDGAYPPGGTTCKRGTLRGARAGHWTGARLLALLLLVPVVNDHLEPGGSVVSACMRGPKARAFGRAPLLVVQLGLLLLEARSLGLHELVKRGQLLPAPCRRPPWQAARRVSTRDGMGSEKGADALFFGACLAAPFCDVVVTMVQDEFGLSGAEISTWATWTGAGAHLEDVWRGERQRQREGKRGESVTHRG